MAILDADKEGFLRSERSLIQTAGRAARNVNGLVIMYGDNITDSMARAIRETDRRREICLLYTSEWRQPEPAPRLAVWIIVNGTTCGASGLCRWCW